MVELAGLAEVTSLQDFLLSSPLPGVKDVVAAARTVLVTASSPTSLEAITRAIRGADLTTPLPEQGRLHTFDTVYDGDDLALVAQLTGMSVEAVLAWHSGQHWKAAFCGFAPGFMYLLPSHGSISLPRKDTPRTAVPAGSVALGGEFSAVYPSPSPGGWQLIGHIGETLWDLSRAAPAVLQPGDRVEFRPARELVKTAHFGLSHSDAGQLDTRRCDSGQNAKMQPSPTVSGIRVLASGLHTTVQDLGRAGFAHLGVSGSGALDRAALRRANRMVGNAYPAGPGLAGLAGLAGLETVLGGLKIQAVGTQIVAVTGGGVTLTLTSADRQQHLVTTDAPFVLRDGEILSLNTSAHAAGFRSYIAFRGGLDVPATLGSRSTDVLSGTGPQMLRVDNFLPVAAAVGASIVGFPEDSPPAPGQVAELRFIPGPREDWFTEESVVAFAHQQWTVTAESNRIGLRLAGVALERAVEMPSDPTPDLPDKIPREPRQRTRGQHRAELPSEGMVDGAIQVPPSGLPVLFLADHPVTGGYPVIGVVVRDDLDKAAQLAPGAKISFRPVRR